jgi:biopolymer transport protein ExbB/TolQ
MRQPLIRWGAVHIVGALSLAVLTGPNADAGTNCFAVPTDDSVWQTIERIGIDQVIGLLLIVALAIALAIIGLRCLRAIASAVKESRAYESRVLTSLYYNRVDEAVNAVDSFPNSPVAAVVSASLQWSARSSPVGGNFGKPANPAFHRALIAQTERLKRSLWLLTAVGWSSTAVGLITSLLRDGYSSGPPVPLCLGLGVAVPAIWLYRGLSSRADLLLFETDRMSLSIVDQIGEVGAFAQATERDDHDSDVQQVRNIRNRPGV